MRPARMPALLLGLLACVFAGLLAHAWAVLPDPAASHFAAGGAADGWMPRATLLWTHAGTALLLSAGTAALCWGIRFFPDRYQNIPRQPYWLAPERRAWYFDWLLGRGLWFGCLALGFCAVQLALTIAANLAHAPRLAMAGVWAAEAAFLVGTVLWLIAMLRFLRRGAMPE